jgi:phytoene dehydrogenase-like protein
LAIAAHSGDCYDAIVVGAGPGGLTAALFLSLEGAKTLVLDMKDAPGGTSRGFMREGFTFPIGALGFTGIAEVTGAFAGIEHLNKPDFRRADYVVDAFGTRVKISRELKRLTNDLATLFPDEAAGVRDFFEYVDAVSRRLSKTPMGEAPPIEPRFTGPAADIVSALVTDAGLRRLLGSIGTCEPYGGFPLLAAMWDVMCERGIWYPEGGFNNFADRLAAAVMSSGGTLRTGAYVLRINVSGGKVNGVLLSDGNRIEAPVVVSNADFKSTFLMLVDADSQPPEWRGAVEKAPIAHSIFQVALGIEDRKADLSAFLDGSHIIHRRGEAPGNDPGPVWKEPEIEPEDLAGQELEVCLWSRDDPGLAPQGRSVMVIRTAADHEHFSRYRPTPGTRLPVYSAYKDLLAGALVREVSRSLVPGLEEAIRVVDIATPLTFEEAGGRFAGSVVGWSQKQPLASDYTVRSLVLTPVEGLYMAGFQAFSWLYLGGVPTAVLSGVEAARYAAAGKGPVSRVMIPGADR